MAWRVAVLWLHVSFLLPAFDTFAVAQDAAVKALVEKLSDADNKIRSAAAAELRQLLACDSGARTNNHGRRYWEERLRQVKPGMKHEDVERLLPAADRMSEVWSGGTGFRQWRLDDYWTVVVHYNYPDSVHEAKAELRRRARETWADPPTDFTGTWTTYYVHGQKSHEVEYKNGKYHGTFTSFHDNGRKLFVQHYVAGMCSGPDHGWYPDGTPSYEGNYVDGKRHGAWTHWTEDGRLRSRDQWRTGESHGVRTSWHENGQKHYERTYRNGKQHGPDKAWTADGELNWSRVYQDGELVENRSSQ